MSDYSAWIGRSETVSDVVEPDRIAGLMALLDRPGSLPDTLPPLGHWLFGRTHAPQAMLDRDGHPKRSETTLLPPIPLPRRMWAGSEIDFVAPIAVGAAIERRTMVAAVDKKRGATGDMIFVALDHVFSTADGVAIRERQHIVYRGTSSGAVPAIANDERVPESECTVMPDPVRLFRYSALTFNAHRIHYDRDYARGVEGYPGLVVHGPYAATLMLDHYSTCYPDVAISGFSFRARAPLFDGAAFELCRAADDLWIRGPGGSVAMTGQVRRG